MRTAFSALALVLALSLPAYAVESDGTEPDPMLSPGKVETQDIAVICDQSTKARRHATLSEKRAVYRAYGLANRHDGFCAAGGGCVLDDRVPIECGGENSPSNLWPQVMTGPYRQDRKNVIEGICHREICAGKITPAEGQAWFLGDWKVEYDRRFGSRVSK